MGVTDYMSDNFYMPEERLLICSRIVANAHLQRREQELNDGIVFFKKRVCTTPEEYIALVKKFYDGFKNIMEDTVK